MSVAGAARAWRLSAAILLVIAGCSAPPEAVTIPTRPPVPDGWIEIDMGTVQVAVPAEWGPDIGSAPGSILVSALIPPGADSVGVVAAGPRGERQPEPPLTDERLTEFLLTWGAGRKPEVYSSSIVLLPAGRAVAIRATHFPGTPDSTEVHVYGIPTAVGVAVIQIIVDTDLLDRYESAMELIPQLFGFGFAESR